MKIVVVDGQGGRLGSLIVAGIVSEQLPCEVLAIGTNSAATAAMLKAGASAGATGENPLIVACRDAGCIIGPIGILSADSLFGEITPAMAVAVGQSPALKLLLPVSHCNNQVVGIRSMSLNDLVHETVDRLKEFLHAG